jgi:hypothetical protein
MEEYMENEQSIVDMLAEGADETQQEVVDEGYSLVDEGANRGRASDMLRRANLKGVAEESQSYVKQMMQQNKTLSENYKKLEAKLNSLEGSHDEIKKSQESQNYKALTDDIVRQEDDLMKDPVYGRFFNREQDRPMMFNYWKGDEGKGVEGKNLTPFEVTAIRNFPELARKLLSYEERFGEIEARKNMQFNSDSNPNAVIDDYTIVRNAPRGSKANAAKELAMKRAVGAFD